MLSKCFLWIGKRLPTLGFLFVLLVLSDAVVASAEEGQAGASKFEANVNYRVGIEEYALGIHREGNVKSQVNYTVTWPVGTVILGAGEDCRHAKGCVMTGSFSPNPPPINEWGYHSFYVNEAKSYTVSVEFYELSTKVRQILTTTFDAQVVSQQVWLSTTPQIVEMQLEDQEMRDLRWWLFNDSAQSVYFTGELQSTEFANCVLSGYPLSGFVSANYSYEVFGKIDGACLGEGSHAITITLQEDSAPGMPKPENPRQVKLPILVTVASVPFEIYIESTAYVTQTQLVTFTVVATNTSDIKRIFAAEVIVAEAPFMTGTITATSSSGEIRPTDRGSDIKFLWASDVQPMQQVAFTVTAEALQPGDHLGVFDWSLSTGEIGFAGVYIYPLPSTPPVPPVINSISPNPAKKGDITCVSGTGFGATQDLVELAYEDYVIHPTITSWSIVKICFSTDDLPVSPYQVRVMVGSEFSNAVAWELWHSLFLPFVVN